MKQRLASLVATAGLVAGMAVVSVGVPGASAVSTPANPDNLGMDFWLAFPGNVPTPTLTLLITGPTDTSGTVDAPGVGFSAPFTVTAGAVTSVVVLSTLDIQTSDTIEDLGIHVTADQEVAVYGLNQKNLSTDGYLGLPTDILGTDYIVEGYKNTGSFNGSEFAVVATQDHTIVTIDPTVQRLANPPGTIYTVVLDQGQTYQLRGLDSGADVSGSIVTSDKPIAVFGGHQCAQIGPDTCNHVVEQLTPTGTWGTSFVTEPFATRSNDVVRYLASTDDTNVWVNGSPAAVPTLDRGKFGEQVLPAASVITSDKPILVTQYMHDGVFPGPPVIPGDPTEVIVAPVDQFMNSYMVATPALLGFTNFINVFAPTASAASVTLDGALVPATSFTAIPGSTFSAAQLVVSPGAHALSGPQPLGAIVYGLGNGDAYAYPGGSSLGSTPPVVTSLTLAPKTDSNQIGTEHCVTATVKDQFDTLMGGVTVAFDVTGANPTSGPKDTGADGTAQFCYVGTTIGQDSIKASAGDVFDTATKDWTPGMSIRALGDAHGWIGLKNGDDQGAKFDVQVELLKNGVTVASGMQRCISPVVRNPSTAKEAIVPWNAFSPVPVASGDVLSIRFSARIGTKPDNSTCNGSHSSAVGLRFYYDAALRTSRFSATIGTNTSDLYLHSDGLMCNNTESPGVSVRTLDINPSTGALPGKCKDSGVIKYAGGNAWSTISTWSLAPLP